VLSIVTSMFSLVAQYVCFDITSLISLSQLTCFFDTTITVADHLVLLFIYF